MAIQDVIDFVKTRAAEFGAKPTSYVFRNNAQNGPDDENRAYFGLIQPDEAPSGAYHDFSLVLFPGGPNQKWIVEVGVGSSGFKNDFELATFPGFRRLFASLIEPENGFCKSDFSDIETKLPNSFAKRDDLRHLSNTVEYYSKYFSACQIIDDPESDEGKTVISAFLAAYAKVRGWANKGQQKEIEKAFRARRRAEGDDPIAEATSLVKERKFVVLQGAPGTGKTRAAKIVATSIGGKVYFTQFHAETSFSDFVHGIAPNIEKDVLLYKAHKGILAEAIEHARNNPGVNTVLIVDEINRANLSNVLGPVFYLFEHKMEDFDIKIEVSPGLSIKSLPENFFVVATMNTADRSLAVVDFALRRRFAWQTLRPRSILGDGFYKDDFVAFDEIFSWHATADELSLQPGQGYFIASSDEEMVNRLKYELYPLIREYLQEGFLRSAKEEFNSYFLVRISQSLFE